MAILVIVLTFAFLTTAALSAAKINAKVRDTDVSFRYSDAPTGDATLTLSGGGTRRGSATVTLYENNGYLYYTAEGDTP